MDEHLWKYNYRCMFAETEKLLEYDRCQNEFQRIGI